MKLVGDPSRFAVGYELDVNYGGPWMYGKFCYFCGSQQVGDYDLGTSLRDVLFQLDEIEKFKFQANLRFSSMSAEDVFGMLDSALFGPAYSKIAEDEQWRDFLIFPSIDVFDGWKGFRLDDGRFSRLIFSSEPYVKVREIKLNNGEIDAVLHSTRKILNAIHERESE